MVLILGLGACRSDLPTTASTATTPPAVTAGWLNVVLATPRSDDGAVQFRLTGPSIDSAVVTGYNGIAEMNGTVADVIVTGVVASGVVARIHVHDLSQSGQYGGSVVAAAARGTYAVEDVSGYRISLNR